MKKGLIRKGLVFSVIVLLIGVSALSSVSSKSRFTNDDTTPPVTNITFDPPEPNIYGWYMDVEVTLEASDDISGVNVTYYRINNGSWIVYTNYILFYESNYYTIEFYSIDNAGNEENTQNASFKVDSIPPITTYTLDPAEPDGENGWYVSNVTVTFSVSDDLSGVWRIIPAPAVIVTEGEDKEVYFYSIDYAGNEEHPRTIEFDIDTTDPDIDIAYEVVDGDPGHGWELEFTATATDAMSGMDRVVFFLNDVEQSVVSGSGPTFKWSFFYAGGLNIVVKAVGFDIAGNSASDEIGARTRGIVIQQSIQTLFLRLLERFPLLNLLLQILY